MPFTEVSRFVGDRWQALPPAQKDEWKRKAAVPWEKYKQELAAYQTTEEFRRYEQYVASFKAAQAAKKNEGKHWVSPGQAGNTDSTNQQRSPKSVSDQSPSAPTLQPRASAQQDTRPFTPQYQVANNLESKVPISRARGQGQHTASTTSTRVNQACQSCRHRRIKCNGERPMCKPCQDYDIDCVYQDGKRDKDKRHDPTL